MLKRKSATFFGLLFLLLYTSSSSAQKGPGGVGKTDGTSSLALWLDASIGFGGSSWLDQSGYVNTATAPTAGATPSLIASDVNGYPSIDFDGTNDELRVTDNASIDLTAWSIFTVTKADLNKNYNALYVKGNDANENYEFLTFSSGLFHLPIKFTDGSRTTPNSSASQYSTTNFDVLEYSFSSIGRDVYKNNTSILTDNESKTPLVNNLDLYIGNERSTSGRFLNGRISEMIIFNQRLNLAQRIITSNYLAAKYGRTLASIDFYNEDNSGAGNFDHNVAGIGQASDGTNHTDSQGTGIIRISNPNNLGNDEFLFWGEDVKDADYTFSASATTNYIERLDTKWRASRRNNPGRVTVRVNASDLTFNSTDGCNQLQLVVDNNSDFSSPDDTYTFTLSGGVYTATNVRFRNNRYFTLQYKDQIVLDGATAYNGAGTLDKPNTDDDCYKMLVKTNTVTLSENGDVREVEIESGAILAVNSGIRLQVTNGINNSGDIRLVGSSQLVQTHTTVANLNTGSGNLHVDQTASTSSIYHSGYWSSPVSVGATYAINDVLKDGSVPTAATATVGEASAISFIAGHDGSSASSPIEISTRWLATFNNAADWTRFVNPTSAVLSPGLGWNMKSVGSTFTFKGIPNDGEYSFPITVDNYSLLGNPYPSALDSEAFITQNTGEFNGELYIYNSASDNTHVRGSYTGTYSTIVSGVSVGAGRYLPIGQAFFVTREVAGTGNITFRNSQRTLLTLADTDGIVARSSVGKKKVESLDLPILKIGFKFDLSETEERSRQVAVAFRGLTNNYDRGFDAEMWGLQPTDMYLKVNDKESPFIITGIEDFNTSLSIPLGVQLDNDRKVKFKIDVVENFDDIPIFLNDKVTGKFYDLSNNEISLDLEQGIYSDRFFITFKKSTLDIEDSLLSEGFTIYNKRKTKELVINNNSTSIIEKITIYNLLGQKLIEVVDALSLNKKQLILNTKKLRNIVYIVNIKTTDGIISKKVF